MSTFTEPSHVFIGSYSDGKRQPAIYDLITKDMTVVKLNISVIDPSYVMCKNGYIYFVEEINNGKVSVVDNSHKLLHTVSAHGKDPCHISIN